jgi:Transglycosylase SLT domain
VTSIAPVAFAPQIVAAAQRNGLDPVLLAAVAAQETGGPGSNSGANVVGDGGHGHGVFQIDDRYHAFASTPAAMDPAQNADYAAGMLSGLLQKYGGNVHAALSAYNAGSPAATGTTTNWGGTTLGYADSVMAHYSQLTGTARDAAMPELFTTSESVNQLASLASSTSATSATPESTLSAVSATPAPTLPTTQQQTQAQQSAAQPALKEDFYADGDDAE